VEDTDFWMNVLLKIKKQMQKLGLGGKIRWALNEFTLPILEFFNFKNVEK
jgi:hypothetical protein